MNTCWKCKNPLRKENIAFCQACGAALGRDANTAKDWALRLEAGNQHLHWGLSLLWFLCGPALLLVFPFLLARANRRLRQHHAQRLAAPAFASSRFTESPEGQTILNRFRRLGGGPFSGNFLQPAVLYLLIATLAGILFVVPAFAPKLVGYSDAMEAVVAGGPVYRWNYCGTSEAYEAAWNDLRKVNYHDFQVIAYSDYGANPSSPALTWKGETDTPSHHRPFLYAGDDGKTNRVSAISFHADYAPAAHVFFVVGLILLYVCQAWFGLSYWLRFARHSQTEVLAAAYARGDLKYHDSMLAMVRFRNGPMVAVAILFAITPGQLVFFPVMSAVTFANHLGWERRTGITAALGLATP